MTSTDDLVVALRNAAQALMATRSIRDLDEMLNQIVASAVQTVPHVDAGGISVAEKGGITSRNPSAATVTRLDQLQAELHEGPCVSAIDHPPADGVVVVQDLDVEGRERWPRFSPEAVAAGYRSVLSTQLTTENGTWAALNLYAATPHVFDEEAHRIAGLFGVQAALLLYGSEQAEHLQHAVDSRDVIGQAKGILMERFTVDDDEAFQMLVRSSQETNLKLVDVAGWLREEARRRRGEKAAVGDG